MVGNHVGSFEAPHVAVAVGAGEVRQGLALDEISQLLGVYLKELGVILLLAPLLPASVVGGGTKARRVILVVRDGGSSQ